MNNQLLIPYDTYYTKIKFLFVTVSPITNWMYMSSFVAEHYMSTPKENPAGYFKNVITG